MLRRLVVVVFLVALAVPLVRLVRGSPARPPSSAAASTASTRADDADTTALRALVPGSAACRDVPRPLPIIRCAIDDLDVEYRLVGTHAVVDAYEAAAGAVVDGARRGAPACASGVVEERSWSRPSAPTIPAGRYRCRIDEGRAVLWWTESSTGLLASAVAADDDLAALFEWWRAEGP
jgi:hypothetical protein